jgi:serine/threonine protein kinase/formylglycine-generating enzyme required for sulfatase activity
MSSQSDPLRTTTEQEGHLIKQNTQDSACDVLSQVGRYRVECALGQGGFGRVYLAHDDQLQRPVAVKVPHRRLVSHPEDAEIYLSEARTVASLDHPNIVPVYDVGSTKDSPFFVVSKFIEGSTLAEQIKASRPSLEEAVALTATVAEALHFAHKRGIIHRDIKPGNILLDQSGKPYVADFGLALREQDVCTGPRWVGTPAYMSPEQARGEGHRVDGRSDIFSLGMVLYELLTGQRPFRAESKDELLEQIANLEVRPPRQIDDRIPKELDRICLKALSKRASERYSTAGDLADDLRHFAQELPSRAKSTGTDRQRGEADSATPALASKTPLTSENQPVKVVPKGLRSFDAGDAYFFLELLPGPRDRDGLPESIRFWKTRIESANAGTFSVGLIYGPSGCGKSSLVKAGLLPRLAKSVAAVYIEATGEETEARLLKGVRRQVPELPTNLGLIDSLISLRRGRFLESGQKLLLVLDQFEQWLHAKRSDENTELLQALRHCDGARLQCLVLVRDDFWLAVSRFMQALEVRLVEGENSRLVDLFDLRHARKVLLAFGTALGALPESGRGKERDAFLDQAVAGLAQESKVVSVRLALFAEMVKGKPWTPTALKEVGGTEGVGVTFLEETFAATTSPPQHRLHQKAARAVLKALLPETGTEIKGNMRSQQQLLEASGYAHRPKDFSELLRILDSELRLITPTDPEGKAEADPAAVPTGARYYQLTHDYLVPSLRDWLTRKQKETRRGRAELLLADRAVVWNARPENRQLPPFLQWLQIRQLTAKKSWTPPQRKMMGKAARFHALRAVMLGVLLALVGWGVYVGHGTLQAHALRERLLDANINEVPVIVQDMAPYRRWLDPLLHDAYAQADKENDRRKQLHSSLALLPVDASQVNYLTDRLLDAEPGEVSVLRDALLPHQEQLLNKLWAVVEAPDKGKESQRLRAAAALAKYDPANAKWVPCGALVVGDLVRVNPFFLLNWSEAYRPVKDALLEPLAYIFRDPRPERAAERSLATNLLTDYAADNPQVLADLLMDADAQQFAVIYPKLKDRGEQGVPKLISEIDKKLPPDMPSSDGKRETLAKRQANAAVALLRMNQPEKVWPLLKHSPDPRVRSYLIHRLSPLEADAGAIIKRLEEEPDITIRLALILSLGEFSDKELPPAARQSLLQKLQGIYRSDADAGLHAAAEWLLRSWKQQDWLKQLNDEWAKDKEQQTKRLKRIRQQLGKDREKTPPQWYVNGQGQTMVVIPGPVEFVMGSPPSEADRYDSETQHTMRIGRTFVLAAAPVTKEQFLKYDPGRSQNKQFRLRYPDPTCPIGGVIWYEAAAYCNWLSEQEGIDEEQWCYEIKNGQVTRLKANYLSLTGYRLPTEAEMEYATRAGALTSRYYGETEDLLPQYAWYFKNSQGKTWPVGSLKPNDFGLFDVLGNVYALCQERYKPYPPSQVEDREDIYSINNVEGRVSRGGSFNNLPPRIRSAVRNGIVPTLGFFEVGIRPARTYR